MKKLSDFNKHEETPFDPNIKMRNKSIVSSRIGEVYSHMSGELISDNVSIVVNKSVDRAEFVKMFHYGLRAMFGIDKSDIKVFLYLLYNLEMNTGKAFFDMKRCMDNIGYKKPWIYKALGRLCENEFIARSSNPKYYWINHSIAFNGSRMLIKKPENIKDV